MASLTKPRLTYFSSRGRSEIIRILLAEIGIDFEEVNVGKWHPTDKTEEFKNLVASGILHFGVLPLYQEPNGFTLTQSAAIIRHLAREHGLYGSNNIEAARCDMIAEGVGDFAPKFISYNSIDSSNTSAREAAKKHLIENDLPKMWRYFETLLLQNNGGKGFFVGNKITYADLVVWFPLENMTDQGLVNLDQFPTLNAFKERIESRPSITSRSYYSYNPIHRETQKEPKKMATPTIVKGLR